MKTPISDKFYNVGEEWRGVPSPRESLAFAQQMERERNQLRIKNENLIDAKIKAQNAECLMELKASMMDQDLETIRKIITKGGTVADVLKFLDTPPA
jgi:hypothetical protein